MFQRGLAAAARAASSLVSLFSSLMVVRTGLLVVDFGGAGVPGRCGGWQRDFLRRPGPGCELAGPVCPGLACVCAVPGFAAAPAPWLVRQGGVAVQAPGGLAGVVS